MLNATSEDLSNYFSQQDNIECLQRKLEVAIAERGRYKRLYAELKDKEIKPKGYRGKEARRLIIELKGTDRRSKLIKLIAKKCFLGESRVGCIWDSV